MNNLIIILIAGVFLAVHFGVLIKLGKKDVGKFWAISVISLYGSGVAHLIALEVAWVGFIAPPLSTVFAGMLVFGAASFYKYSLPDWSMKALVGLTIFRGLIQPVVPPLFNYLPGSLLIVIAALISAWFMLRTRRLNIWNILFGIGCISILASALVFSWSAITEGDPQMVLTVWVLSAIFMGGSQVLLLLNRVAQENRHLNVVLSSMLENVPSGILLLDKFGVVETMNTRFAELLEIDDPRRLAGQPVSQLVHKFRLLVAGELTSEQESSLQSVSFNRTSEPVEFHMTTGIDLLCSSSRLAGSREKKAELLWYMEDITPAKHFRKKESEQKDLDEKNQETTADDHPQVLRLKSE